MALEPGALQQVEHRHGGLTDMHASRVNVACRLRALERYSSENGGAGANLVNLSLDKTLSLFSL